MLAIALIIGWAAAGTTQTAPKENKALTCKVAKLAAAPKLDGNWDQAPWKDIQPELIGNFMGKKPEHLPKTQVKIAYDDEALYLIFRVEDQYVRAVAPGHQRIVCTDSCVEFFFTPGTNLAVGYFNLEMNCGGSMLFRFQTAPDKGQVAVAERDLEKIKVFHSLPKIVDPEMKDPVTWTVEYRIPLQVIKDYAPMAAPAKGVAWRANFYKCADGTSHPHWLTWSPVGFPSPRFHLPEFFGTLEFE
jgi:hypothetical protein